jgi:hypothetical protein
MNCEIRGLCNWLPGVDSDWQYTLVLLRLLVLYPVKYTVYYLRSTSGLAA